MSMSGLILFSFFFTKSLKNKQKTDLLMLTITHCFLIRRKILGKYGKTLKLSTFLKYAYYLGLFGIYYHRNICEIYQYILCVYYLGLARRYGRLSPPDDAISGMADASRCQRRQFSIELRQCLHKNTKKTENTTFRNAKKQTIKIQKNQQQKMADAPPPPPVKDANFL